MCLVRVDIVPAYYIKKQISRIIPYRMETVADKENITFSVLDNKQDLDNCNHVLYCLSYNNPERRGKMSKQFRNMGLDVKFTEGVDFKDDRIQGRGLSSHQMRVWSCMYGHLDILSDFLNTSDAAFCVVCEDDIIIRRDFSEHLETIMEHNQEMKLDLLMLGHLFYNNHKVGISEEYPQIADWFDSTQHTFNYYRYPCNRESGFWGSQMYMITRKHAQYLVDKYAEGYADATLANDQLIPFSADWTITKEGNCGFIYPLIAIEDQPNGYTDVGQHQIREMSYAANYDPTLFP
jgi:GR25 family glycosyltransferase involved in LPS biosynthesis